MSKAKSQSVTNYKHQGSIFFVCAWNLTIYRSKMMFRKLQLNLFHSVPARLWRSVHCLSTMQESVSSWCSRVIHATVTQLKTYIALLFFFGGGGVEGGQCWYEPRLLQEKSFVYGDQASNHFFPFEHFTSNSYSNSQTHGSQRNQRSSWIETFHRWTTRIYSKKFEDFR